MYIKSRRLASWDKLWDYRIFSSNGTVLCTSADSWKTLGGATRAAIKLATDLGIEYRETK